MAVHLQQRLWTPLDPSRSEIRLLHLRPLQLVNSPLYGTLQASSLDHHLLYDALSWAWGPPEPMVSIVINDIRGWRIPARLDTYLRRLCFRTERRPIWVDALCVDQLNQTERAQQVQCMERVFSSAHTVWVCLGVSSLDTHQRQPDHFYRSLTECLGLDQKNLSVQASKFVNSRIVSKALAEEWWSRVWPMQEIILARNLQVYFSDQTLGSSEMLNIIQEIGLQTPRTNEFAWLCQFRVRNSSRNKSATEITQLLHYSRLRSTSDSRDKIYGILGACTFLIGSDFLQPNYQQSVSDIYREFTSQLIGRLPQRPLTFLNQVVPLHHTYPTAVAQDSEYNVGSTESDTNSRDDPAGNASHDNPLNMTHVYNWTQELMPTWVPDLRSRYDHVNEMRRLKYQDQGHAARSLVSPTTLNMQPKAHKCTLICHGMIFDTVDQVFDLCEANVKVDAEEELKYYARKTLSWLNIYYEHCEMRKGSSDSNFSTQWFWQTIYRDRDLRGELRSMLFEAYACLTLWRNIPFEAPIGLQNKTAIINLGQSVERHKPQTLGQYFGNNSDLLQSISSTSQRSSTVSVSSPFGGLQVSKRPTYANTSTTPAAFFGVNHDLMQPRNSMPSERLVRRAQELMQPVSPAQAQRSQQISEVKDRLRTNLADCRLFITVSGKLGLGPSDTTNADAIAVIVGGSVPYILRPLVHANDSSRESTFNFVGECYVQNAMNGEIKGESGLEKIFII